MSRHDPPRTLSIGLEERGQTVQDFAVGIGIFILAVAFVFSFVPTIISPFADGGGAETAQADRIAATIVDDLEEGEPNHVDLDEFDDTYSEESYDLVDKLGLRSSDGHAFDRVNITVTTIGEEDPTVDLSGGDEYDDQVGASATRIVTDVDGDCDPACKITVRVW